MLYAVSLVNYVLLPLQEDVVNESPTHGPESLMCLYRLMCSPPPPHPGRSLAIVSVREARVDVRGWKAVCSTY